MLKLATLIITGLITNFAYCDAKPTDDIGKAGKEAARHTEKTKPVGEEANYQQITDEYKAYLATVDKNIRDEIVEFRKEIAKLNKQKHNLYKTLSQEAQNYLAKERELKRKLPKDQRKALENNDIEK